ncbi:hypothetical protein D9M72_422690 [compost metagenome]
MPTYEYAAWGSFGGGCQDDAVATVRRIATPKAEWVLMYRGGLARTRIGAPGSTVGYYLAVGRAADPGLEAAHQEPAGGKTARVGAHGLERIRELAAVVQETGRNPSPRSRAAAERSLGCGWSAAAAKPSKGRWHPSTARDGGATGWQGASRTVVGEARGRTGCLPWVTYRAAAGRKPGAPGG